MKRSVAHELLVAEEKAGLMKIKAVTITTSRTTIQRQNIANTPTTILQQTHYKFAIVLFHGDGDPSLLITVTRGNQTFTLYGHEQAIEIVSDETLKIEATSGTGFSPTIEIVFLSW